MWKTQFFSLDMGIFLRQFFSYIQIGTLHFTGVFNTNSDLWIGVDRIQIGTLHFTVFLVLTRTYKLVWTEFWILKKTMSKERNAVFHVGIGGNRYQKTYNFIGWTYSQPLLGYEPLKSPILSSMRVGVVGEKKRGRQARKSRGPSRKVSTGFVREQLLPVLHPLEMRILARNSLPWVLQEISCETSCEITNRWVSTNLIPTCIS